MDGEVMSDNSFFKPTLLYKEFMILDLIEKDANITQREISKTIGVAVSMINSYVTEYEKKGLIKRKKHSTKTVEYFVTKKGMERRKLLNISYLSAAQKIYSSAKENILAFLSELSEQGFKKLLFYGAGDVAEIILQTIINEKYNSIMVEAIIDDDVTKQNTNLLGYDILSFKNINNYDYDGILISSFSENSVIYNKLIESDIQSNKIIRFFNI